MYFRVKRTGPYPYLQIVESYREGSTVKQRVLMTVGRVDLLQQSGQLEGLLRSGLRFCEQLVVLDAHASGQTEPVAVRTIGPDLVFGRLWEETGIGPIVRSLLSERAFEFPVERAVYLTVLHRLFASGSDRAAERWREDYRIAGSEALQLHHLYRAMGWLGGPTGEGLPTLGAPRSLKDRIEEALFEQRRDLFAEIDLVFFDTTSIYFEGQGGESLGQYGHSKDHRPDLKQMVVGLALDAQGWPVCCHLWPGNTADVKTLVPVVEGMKRRFAVKRVCIVADRGMISRKVIQALEADAVPCSYILGVRMRAVKEVREKVLRDRHAYQEIYPERTGRTDPAPLQVKDVTLGGRRYIVCRNEEQRRKDQADREAIVAHLREQLRRGDKSLIGNQGYRKYLKTIGEARFALDEAKIRQEARYDGLWVLNTNTGWEAEVVATAYKQLWTVEDLFRTMKSVLDTRPIYHKCDDTIRGHVFCSYLALVLRRALERRLEQKSQEWEWPEILRGLDHLQEVEAVFRGKRFLLRSQLLGQAHRACMAAGVAVPPPLRALN